MHSTTHSDDHCQAQGWEDHLSCAEEVIAILVFSVLCFRIIASSETLLLLFPISSESFVFSIILTREGLGQPNVKFKIDKREEVRHKAYTAIVVSDYSPSFPSQVRST
jgi:hypothetical protein